MLPQPDLILPRLLVPVRPSRQVLENMAVVVHGSTIAAVMPRGEAVERWPGARQTVLDEHILLPGLINMHTHSPMTLLRGYADDLDLQVWLNDFIWPAEKAFMGPDFVEAGTELAVAEMLRGGTTCFSEMYFFPEVIAAAASRAGMRAVIGLPVIDFPTAWANGCDECIDKGLRLSEGWRDDPLITTALAPHTPYSVDDAALRRVAALSEERALRVHMHVLETAWEIEESERWHGKSTLQRLADLGLLNERLLAVHMTQLDDTDITRLARAKVNVIHCPESNLKLASGMCREVDLMEAGINVALGTDGAASNNDLDLLGEARTAALLAKGVAGDPCALDAFQALEMLTINAAVALGQADCLGSVEAGKLADLCAVRLDALSTTPVYDPVSHLVYAASSRQVSHVWVAGQALLADGEFLNIDTTNIIEQAHAWQTRISAGASVAAGQAR